MAAMCCCCSCMPWVCQLGTSVTSWSMRQGMQVRKRSCSCCVCCMPVQYEQSTLHEFCSMIQQAVVRLGPFVLTALGVSTCSNSPYAAVKGEKEAGWSEGTAPAKKREMRQENLGSSSKRVSFFVCVSCIVNFTNLVCLKIKTQYTCSPANMQRSLWR